MERRCALRAAPHSPRGCNSEGRPANQRYLAARVEGGGSDERATRQAQIVPPFEHRLRESDASSDAHAGGVPITRRTSSPSDRSAGSEPKFT